MGREDEIVKERIKKIDELRSKKINPYAHKFEFEKERVHSDFVLKNFESLKNEEVSSKEAAIAGRVMFLRSFGKLAFAKVQDLKGNLQIVLQSEKTPEKAFDLFSKVDSGDIIGVKGNVMRTKTGELSILVKELQILTKSIFPLPDKVKGLTDEEEKLRKRYLDIIMNPEVKELFIKKQKFWGTIRNFLIENGFLEVETPVLENSAGGAAATPFATHHNALDLDVFLRISMGELWQKKLMVAGYEKTFEIGRQFRNEGMDAEHLQDYSQIEFYWAYADFNDGMKLTEEMYKKVAMAVNGSLEFEIRGHKVNLGKKWELYDYESLIESKTGLNIYKADKKEIMKFLKEQSIEFDANVDKWRLVDVLWKFCRKQLSGPGFLVGQPVELSPLAKRSEEDPRKVEQFQIILAGSEVGNGYSELNDPIDQESRFIEQKKHKDAGDSESMDHDEGFIEALKYAMPPTCGFGVSERLFSTLVGKPIRECVIFPLMKPNNYKEIKEDQEEKIDKKPVEKKEDKKSGVEKLAKQDKNPSLFPGKLSSVKKGSLK
jgi:lysyl-tRNA synthetase class 2